VALRDWPLLHSHIERGSFPNIVKAEKLLFRVAERWTLCRRLLRGFVGPSLGNTKPRLDRAGLGLKLSNPMTLDANGNLSPGGVKVLTLGGADASGTITATTEIFTDADPDGSWSGAAPMATARQQLNALLLPDGNVLVVGGENG